MSDQSKSMTETSQVQVGTIKIVDHVALEGTNQGNHLQPAADAVLPAQPAPRDEKAGR